MYQYSPYYDTEFKVTPPCCVFCPIYNWVLCQKINRQLYIQPPILNDDEELNEDEPKDEDIPAIKTTPPQPVKPLYPYNFGLYPYYYPTVQGPVYPITPYHQNHYDYQHHYDYDYDYNYDSEKK